LLGEAANPILERAAVLYEQEVRLMASRDWEQMNAEGFCAFLERLCAIESEAVGEIEKTIIEGSE
jgi:hypothetical protein